MFEPMEKIHISVDNEGTIDQPSTSTSTGSSFKYRPTNSALSRSLKFGQKTETVTYTTSSFKTRTVEDLLNESEEEFVFFF